MRGVSLCESEQHNAKAAKSNTTKRACYQDRLYAVLQRRAESHDNHTYPQYSDNLSEHTRGMERARL